MLVLDASALLAVVLGASADTEYWQDRLVAEVVHAPHLIDVEYANGLRRLVHRSELAAEPATLLLGDGPLLVDVRHDHRQLAATAWSLRDNLTFYDALYVALAVGLGVPLVTSDARLARAPGLPCRVEVLAR